MPNCWHLQQNFLISKIYLLTVELALEVNNCLITTYLRSFNLSGTFLHTELLSIIYNGHKAKTKLTFLAQYSIKSSQYRIIIHNCLQPLIYPKTGVWPSQASAIGPLMCNNHRPVPLRNTLPTQVDCQSSVAVGQCRRNKLVKTVLINNKTCKDEFRDA